MISGKIRQTAGRYVVYFVPGTFKVQVTTLPRLPLPVSRCRRQVRLDASLACLPPSSSIAPVQDTAADLKSVQYFLELSIRDLLDQRLGKPNAAHPSNACFQTKISGFMHFRNYFNAACRLASLVFCMVDDATESLNRSVDRYAHGNGLLISILPVRWCHRSRILALPRGTLHSCVLANGW